MNAPFSPPTELQGLRGLRGMLAAIGSVGPVDGFDVIRRASVLELADRFISMGEEAPDTGHWIAADDLHRNVKELDEAFNGAGGATGPLLIDVLSQVAGEARKLGMPILTALKMGKPIGYVIEHADGTRWRTMDSIGMPAWTNDKAEALCVSLRMHAERFSEDDEEDIRIKPVWEMPRMEGETVESVIACLGDDAATLRERNPDCEIAANMERAAELLVRASAAAVADHRVMELDKIFSDVMGCFDAAYIEGLDQALAKSVGSEPGSLHDLVARRIMPAYSILKGAKDQDAHGNKAAPVESFVGVSSSADFDTDQWIFTMKPPYKVGAGEYLITPLASRKNTVGDAA